MERERSSTGEWKGGKHAEACLWMLLDVRRKRAALSGSERRMRYGCFKMWRGGIRKNASSKKRGMGREEGEKASRKGGIGC
jgi:hypothetical protein